LPIDYQNKEKKKMKDMTVMVANLMAVAATTGPQRRSIKVSGGGKAGIFSPP
jgi:hypothetical protein